MARNQSVDYFKTFVEAVDFSCSASALLHESFLSFEPGRLKDRLDEMHRIEHSADLAKHEMMSHLVREFITPIEREDIIELANTLDDVTDTVEEVLLRTYRFNILSIPADALAFTEVIEKCCCALHQAVQEFPNYKKSEILRERIIRVSHYEEEGDRLYTDAVHALYTGGHDPLQVMALSSVYECLEDCCDACEHVADALERVIMKNS